MSLATAPAKQMSEQSFQFIASLVLRKSAIVLEKSKTYLIESRLLPVARENNLASIDELVAELRRPTSARLTASVVDAMTTNETSFFRDLHPFDALRKTILPDLIAKRSSQRVLNIWSNACSSGQEVYSVAMLIREHFPQLASWRIRLMATDLSSQILEKAESGLFTQTEINRGLPMPMTLKYFNREGMSWRISDEIRNMVEFRPLNLVESWPPTLPKMDVVFLRNVLIYFSVDSKRQILQRLHRSMHRDGVLFLGGAETTMNLNVPFERRLTEKATAYYPV